MSSLFSASPEVLVYRFTLPHGWVEQPWWSKVLRLSLDPSDLIVYIPHDHLHDSETLETAVSRIQEFVDKLTQPLDIYDTSKLCSVAGLEVWVFSPYSPHRFIDRAGTRTPDSGLSAKALQVVLGFDPLRYFTLSDNPAFEGIHPVVVSNETNPPTKLYLIPSGG